MSKSRFPVSSFDPRFIEALLKAAAGDTTVFSLPSLKAARAMQSRFNLLRSRMRAENDARYDIVCRATTSLRNADGSSFTRGQSQDGPKQLHILPRDYQFAKVFSEAGVAPAPTLTQAEGHDILNDIPDGPVPEIDTDLEK